MDPVNDGQFYLRPLIKTNCPSLHNKEMTEDKKKYIFDQKWIGRKPSSSHRTISSASFPACLNFSAVKWWRRMFAICQSQLIWEWAEQSNKTSFCGIFGNLLRLWTFVFFSLARMTWKIIEVEFLKNILRHWQTWTLFSLLSRSSLIISWKILMPLRSTIREAVGKRSRGAGQEGRCLLDPWRTRPLSAITLASPCLPAKPRHLHHEPTCFQFMT